MADLRFNVSAETRAATAALGSFAQSVQKNLVQAVRALPNIEITADSSDAEREMKRIRDEMADLANKKVGVDIDAEAAVREVERLQRELQQLSGSTADVGIRANADQASKALDSIQAQVRSVDGQDAEVQVTADTRQAEGEVSGLGSKLNGVSRTAGIAIGTALGDAASDLITTAIQSAIETSVANARLEAQLIGNPEAYAAAGKAAGSLWSRGYGESLDEVNQAVFAVMTSSQEMRDASAADLTAVTESALNLSKTWGVDVSEAMRGVGQLVTTELVPNTQAGLGLMHQAFADLGPAGQDAIDTMVEYSTQFRQLGLDGPAAMALVSQGIQAGARDTDTVADALKEFTLIAQEGGDEASAAFARIGLNGAEMSRKIAEGGPGAREALDKTLEGLRGIEDPALRAQLAVDLFGTKAEDLQQALFALDPTPTEQKFTDLESTMGDVNKTMEDTAQTSLNEVSRGFRGLFTNIGDTEGLVGSMLSIWTGAMGLFGSSTEDTMSDAGEAIAGVGAELGLVAERFAAVPPGKSITVDALTDDARARLDELGFDVRELPDGSFEVIPQTEGAVAALDALVADVATRSAVLQLDANPDPATGKIQGTLDLGNGAVTTVTLDANPDPATGKITGTVDLGNGQTATITLDGNPDPATGKINATVVDGNGRTSRITVDANNLPANQRTDAAAQHANNQRPRFPVDADTGPATSVIDDLRSWASRTVSFVVRAITGNYAGGIYGPGPAASYFAGGGMVTGTGDPMTGRRMTPMPTGVPAVAEPGHLRVFGDRPDVPESYIPWKPDSLRAHALLDTTAAALGRTVLPRGVTAMAGGGTLTPGAAPAMWSSLQAPSAATRAVISAAQVSAAVGTARGFTAAHGDAIVAGLAAIRGEVRGMAADMARRDLSAAQLAELRGIRGAQQAARSAPATAEAQTGLNRSALGAW